MSSFMDKDFLLYSDTAKNLYHEYAEKMPIIDYHCHVSPYEIRDNKKFKSITEVWLGGDHYKWRAMRAMGINEENITGKGSDREKFRAWAKTIPYLIGNPLYHWTHLELQRYFGIHEPLTLENADDIFDRCNEILQQDNMTVRGIIKQSNVKLICTTDDPIDSLDAHKELAKDKEAVATVLPAFRPDKAINIYKPEFVEYINKLGEVCGFEINSIENVKKALSNRMDYFGESGCTVSDHALDAAIFKYKPEKEINKIFIKSIEGKDLSEKDITAYQTHVLLFLASEYKKRNWVMQIHLGTLRNHSSAMYKSIGPDTGYDGINKTSDPAKLVSFFDELEKNNNLPKTILYSMNPADNEVLLSVLGSFQTNKDIPGYIQLGSAWWMNDHLKGMEKQMSDLASMGVWGSFIGMLTDSRSFLSYTRHEYFRRLLCNMIGDLVEKGQYPNDKKMLKKLVEGISYYNAKDYFGFNV